MPSELIIAGIKATLRAAQAGASLYSEHARDRAIFLPDIELPPGSEQSKLREFLLDNPDLTQKIPEFKVVWDAEDQLLIDSAPQVMDAAIAQMFKHKALSKLQVQGADQANEEATLLAGGRMVEQWRKEKKPPSPLARMALTITDIGFEFVVANPSLLGVGTKGEKLVVAFATNMTEVIPDSVNQFGSKEQFSDRVFGIFLRAGLSTLAANSSTIISDQNVAKLIKGVTLPVVEAFPETLAEQIHYSEIVEAIAGSAAEVALSLLSENTNEYLGGELANDAALGAVTSALFEQIKSITAAGCITDTFTHSGTVSLYEAGLSVAKRHPELFIKDTGEPVTELFQNLLSGTSETLIQHKNLKGSVGAAIGAMAIEVIGEHATGMLKLSSDKPWEQVTIDVINQVAGAINTALDSSSGSIQLLDDKQIVEIGRIVLTQVSKSPGMIGADRTEIAAIVSGLLEAMSADDTLLLTGNEWLRVIGVAAEKAAENPGKLFSFADSSGEQLATKVIKSVLNAAGTKWQQGGRESGTLLFGPLLGDVLETALSSLAGNITGVVNNPSIIGQFTTQLLEFAENNPNQIGSDNLRFLFKTLIVEVIATGELPDNPTIKRHLS